MAETVLYKETLIVDKSISRFQIQQAMENSRTPHRRIPILDDNYDLVDTYPVDGNVRVAIAMQQEDQIVTVSADRVPSPRTHRIDAPDAISHAKVIVAAIRTIKAAKSGSGRNQDGCNVWLEYMMVTKGKTARTDKPEGNDIFDLWRQLNAWENGHAKDNTAAAFTRYEKAVARIKGKNI